jgi:hypothetical protein
MSSCYDVLSRTKNKVVVVTNFVEYIDILVCYFLSPSVAVRLIMTNNNSIRVISHKEEERKEGERRRRKKE